MVSAGAPAGRSHTGHGCAVARGELGHRAAADLDAGRPPLSRCVRCGSGRRACAVPAPHAPRQDLWWRRALPDAGRRGPAGYRAFRRGPCGHSRMTATPDKARGFAVSNLVWPDTDRDTAPAVAGSLGFRALELAPVKAWGAWEEAMPADAAALRRRFADQQLEIAALQGICHGVEGLALFGPAAARRRLADHLRRVAEFAAACGGVPCVFGAPRIRDPGDLAPEAAMEQAAEFFAAVAPTYHACS